uniref:CDK-activating kinase assembly factor MAT1 n=1 Tax=Ursus americanus TaxID=9643 RepID=A0A452RS21_URSAM
MDDQGCPRCKTTKYRNPSLKLMVNVCGHTLCESCVDLLFMRGAGNCPECGTPLRKSNFRVQLFEDPTVDKEVEIRKKVLKIYNKREEDFPSLREYNDFLEEVEEIVFNLTNNVDLDNTKKKMEMYQKENKDVIQKNKLKLTREQEELEEALEVERQENEQRRLFIQKEEQLQQILKRKNKQAFLDELESSDLPVALLLAQHKDRSTQLEMQLEKPKPIKPVTFSTGIKMVSCILILSELPQSEICVTITEVKKKVLSVLGQYSILFPHRPFRSSFVNLATYIWDHACCCCSFLLSNIPFYGYTSFFIHSSVERHLDLCFVF